MLKMKSTFARNYNLDILDSWISMRIYGIFAQVCVNIFVIANAKRPTVQQQTNDKK